MEKKELHIKVDENELGQSIDNNSVSHSFELLRELLENSHATKREIEGLSDLIKLKDNRIKDVEDELSELEIKLSVYRERVNMYKEKIQDKDDLIAALSLDSTTIANKLNKCIELFSTMKEQHQIAKYEVIIKEKDEQIMELESSLKTSEIKLINQNTLNMSNIFTIGKLYDTIEQLTKAKKEIRIYAPYGTKEPIMHVPGIDSFVPTINDKIDGPGWIVIQRRSESSVSFERNLAAYHDGFGNFGTVGDFWLGLERMHKITSQQQHQLLVYYVDHTKRSYYALYDNFVVGSKDEDYALKSLGNYKGNSSDMLRSSLNANFVVSEIYKNGWWYTANSAPNCNLNGQISGNQSNLSSPEHLFWGFKCGGTGINKIQSAEMLIRPKLGLE